MLLYCFFVCIFMFYSGYLLRFATGKLWNLIFFKGAVFKLILLCEENKRIKFNCPTFQNSHLNLTPYLLPFLNMLHLTFPYKIQKVFLVFYFFTLVSLVWCFEIRCLILMTWASESGAPLLMSWHSGF